MERNRRKLTLPLSNAVTTLSSDTVFSPCFSQTQASPMSALSSSMGAMSCLGNTPKRRLSLSGIGETPPARPKSLSRHSSHSSGVSTGTPSPCESPVSGGEEIRFNPISNHSQGDSQELNLNRPPRGLFRRFNSMPLRLQQQDSPSLPLFTRPRRLRRESIQELSEEDGQNEQRRGEAEENEEEEEEDGLWMKRFEASRTDEEMTREENSKRLRIGLPSPSEMDECSLPGSSKGFTFVMPRPLSARAAPARRSSLSFGPAANRPISAPATLLEGADDDDDDDDNIQLGHDRLTSFNDDEEENVQQDDGFSEIFDSDSQEGPASGMSEGFAGLLHGELIGHSRVQSPPTVLQASTKDNVPLRSIDCNAVRTTPSPVGPRCRKGIFKVPSQPAMMMRRNSSFLKRAERPQDTPSPIQNKRPRSSSICSPQVGRKDIVMKEGSSSKKQLGRSLSMMSPNDPYFQRIDQALSMEGGQNELIGDSTKACCLPTVPGKQKDLKSISPETMCRLLGSEFGQEIGELIIVDCRYPYEYRGGHIQGALNIYQEEDLKRRFLDNPLGCLPGNKRRVFIFHCEFSSHRGPRMLRCLRKEDRSANLENYPALYYPELYILNDGYKAFYEYNTDFCEPRSYLPMNHKNHVDDLRHFRAKSKSWNGEKSRLKAVRSSIF